MVNRSKMGATISKGESLVQHDLNRGLEADYALVAYGADGPIGFELCGDAVGSCHYASADIRNNRVTLRAPAAHEATRVRWCWADSPVCTLYDSDGSSTGLPVGPFERAIPSMPYDDHAR